MKNYVPGCSAILLLILFIFPASAFAQEGLQKTQKLLREDSKVKNFSINDELKTVSVVAFKENTVLNAADAKTVISNYFDLTRPGAELRLQSSNVLRSGIQVQRYKLFVNNIPVVHSSYNVMIRNNRILSIHAESYALGNNFSITPALPADIARVKALEFVRARKYAWEALAEDKLKAAGNAALIQQIDKLIDEHFPTGELVIAKNKYGDGQARLAWKFDVYAVEPLGRYYIYVDAETGRILLRDAIIKHTGETQKKDAGVDKKIPVTNSKRPFLNNAFQPIPAAPLASELASGTTRYAGTRSFYTTRLSVPLLGMNDPNNTSAPLQYSGVDPRVPVVGPIDVFILKDDTRGGGIETYDMNGAGGLPVSVPTLQTTALAFLDKDNNWLNEAAAGTNEDLIRGATFDGSNGADEAFNDDYAIDAHWGAEMVYDYWKNVHNRLSFDNLNSAIKSYVHYGPAYDNAFWNGSVMTYGDGSGTTATGFRPLTSLDVCAHEIGHGVCSFTSDLVYESESGAMNEALSDIWAACLERYVKVNVDPLLPYYPFQIGEQIAGDNVGLRRMDNPKAKTDPDTYGGQYWANPVCTPTLANDQCGVHTNSGILNKWFYLLVQGPGTTTGLPAVTDDGLADNGAVINGGNDYGALGPAGTGEFLGIGFNKAEAITYLMEQLLTPNATFAQARIASINAVRALYGECSQEEKSVTDAWFAINVGPSYTSCALPVISASTLVTDIIETAPGTCVRYNEYNINTNLTVAQASAVTINFSVGATTMSSDEYSLSASSVTYNIGETGLRTVKLRIYDDAMIEADETITIDANSSSPALSTSFNFTVRNDDMEPVFGSAISLLNENFESTTPGSLPAGWSAINKTSAPPIQWAVREDGIGLLNWTGKRVIIEQTAVPGIATYDQLVEAQVILKTPLINATGLNSIRVQFVFQAGGEPACTPACDYAQLVYSLDGTTFNTAVGASTPLYLTITDSMYNYVLPPHLNGKQFYLGVIWINDANAGTTASVTIDNFTVTANGRALETVLASTVSEKVNAETGKPSYFYSTADAELIARISNSTAHNYGCVSTTLEKAGTSGFELYVSGIDHHRVADKVIRVTPVTNNAAGSYDIRLHLTEAEITALEAYTGYTRNQFFIYKTTANHYTGATAANTEFTAATYTAIPGLGGSFSASFSTGFSVAFAIGASVSIPLPVNCLDFKAVKKDNSVELVWKVNQEINNSHFTIERSEDGITYTGIAMVPANISNNGNYSFTDNNLSGKRAYYRLRQTDRDGTNKYVCGILSLSLDNSTDFSIGNIYPNPSAGQSFVNIYTSKARMVTMEYVNTLGQVFNKHAVQLQPGTTRVTLNLNTRAGNFIVRFRDEAGVILGHQKFSRF